MVTILGWKINSKVLIANLLVLLVSLVDVLQSNLDGVQPFVPAVVYQMMPFWLTILNIMLRVWFPTIQPITRKGVLVPVDTDTSVDISEPITDTATPVTAPTPGYISIPVPGSPDILVPIEAVQALIAHGIPAVTDLLSKAATDGGAK